MVHDLWKRIELHERWQTSLGAQSERLSQIGEDLRGVDLSGAPSCSAAELPGAVVSFSTGPPPIPRVNG